MPSDLIVLTTLCGGLGTAALIDVFERRIPNGVSMSMLGAGLLLSAAGISGITVGSAIVGLVVGFLLMMPGHVLGKTGAGDVKLFAAAGTLLGSSRIVPAFLLVAIAGGVLALMFAWRRGRIKRTISLAAQLCGQGHTVKAAIESPAEHNRFPYGPAIAVGCVIAAWR